MTKKKIGKALKFILLLIIGFLVIGLIFQYSYDRNTSKKHKPKGSFVELEHGNINYEFIGNGDYTLVLETGLGENSFTWSKIKDSLKQTNRVFMYDRAGLGFSDFSDTPRTSSQIAKELKQILDKASIPGPYVLVGHSIGGVHLRYFARLYPDNVVGLFLIDPSHENMVLEITTANTLDGFYHFSLKHLSKTGLPYAIMPDFLHPINKTSKNIKTYGYEIDAIDTSMAELRASKSDVSDLPIYVISCLSNNENNNISHRDLLRELIEKSNSDIKALFEYEKPHYIHITDPEIVITHLNTFISELKESSMHKSYTIN